jgi:hypothetical protein
MRFNSTKKAAVDRNLLSGSPGPQSHENCAFGFGTNSSLDLKSMMRSISESEFAVCPHILRSRPSNSKFVSVAIEEGRGLLQVGHPWIPTNEVS